MVHIKLVRPAPGRKVQLSSRYQPRVGSWCTQRAVIVLPFPVSDELNQPMKSGSTYPAVHEVDPITC